MNSTPVLKLYYGATALFVLLDYVLNVNVRLAFLEAWPGWRALYYVFCFCCLGLIAWRPVLTTLVSTVESLITLSALILSMGVRAFGVSATVIETGGGYVTPAEIVNFVIAGGVAWLAWSRGSARLHREWRNR